MLKSKQLQTFFLRCQFLPSESKNLHDNPYLVRFKSTIRFEKLLFDQSKSTSPFWNHHRLFFSPLHVLSFISTSAVQPFKLNQNCYLLFVPNRCIGVMFVLHFVNSNIIFFSSVFLLLVICICWHNKKNLFRYIFINSACRNTFSRFNIP